ncbi:hypothetical protein DE4576_04322 [Mycobacterium marinum]|uniref:Uncharacterized protein n=1 Tax=Mycobacterium marinum TaxID=1781 RepID=A0A3E2N252_MYCMR|nr:hypothetical protein DAVIS_00516 [Mycobacterium marinum]RFZ64035.1 hypothetical protein DE4576_04322 [Mycobacterium marinum]
MSHRIATATECAQPGVLGDQATGPRRHDTGPASAPSIAE